MILLNGASERIFNPSRYTGLARYSVAHIEFSPIITMQKLNGYVYT